MPCGRWSKTVETPNLHLGLVGLIAINHCESCMLYFANCRPLYMTMKTHDRYIKLSLVGRFCIRPATALCKAWLANSTSSQLYCYKCLWALFIVSWSSLTNIIMLNKTTVWSIKQHKFINWHKIMVRLRVITFLPNLKSSWESFYLTWADFKLRSTPLGTL